MSNTEDKSSTANGLATDPPRLASFKTPRDRSLGGIKSNRKLFTPNLVVTRNRIKGHRSLNTRQNEDKYKKNIKNDKKYKNGPRVIKSSGVFSEGLGGVERRSNPVSFNREENHASPDRASLRIRSRIKADQEDLGIGIVVGDGHGGEEGDEDCKGRLEMDGPISLPMGDTGLCKRVAKLPVKVKQECDTNTELEDDILSAFKHKMHFVDVKEEELADIDVIDMLKNEEPTLILIQLPSSLPGRGGRADEDSPRSRHQQHQPATDAGSEEKTVDGGRCHLGELSEGRIGRLRVHRSGGVTLALGDVVLDVVSGVPSCFHQEAVSAAADEPSRSATLVSLGALRRKLVVFPHWRRLLRGGAPLAPRESAAV